MRDRQAGAGRTLPARITSLQNDRIKAIRALEMRKARRETGLFLAEGTSLIITAREHGWTPRTLIVGPDGGGGAARDLVDWALRSGADCLEVSAAVLAKIAAKENPQSLMAVFEQRWSPPPSPAAVRADALWIVLEQIRDPGNLGTIIRTAEAAGAAGVILVGQTCDPYAREAVRASMGSIFAVPVARLAGVDAFVALAAAWPGDVVGAHLAGAVDYRDANYAPPSLLVMGSEGAGLTQAAAAACGRLVRIPMAGRLDSLNLAVATALIAYEIRRPLLKL
jgi:TrmH family RNA methyltransferase